VGTISSRSLISLKARAEAFKSAKASGPAPVLSPRWCSVRANGIQVDAPAHWQALPGSGEEESRSLGEIFFRSPGRRIGQMRVESTKEGIHHLPDALISTALARLRQILRRGG